MVSMLFREGQEVALVSKRKGDVAEYVRVESAGEDGIVSIDAYRANFDAVTGDGVPFEYGHHTETGAVYNMQGEQIISAVRTWVCTRRIQPRFNIRPLTEEEKRMRSKVETTIGLMSEIQRHISDHRSANVPVHIPASLFEALQNSVEISGSVN